MSHPIETAKKDVIALPLLLLIWLAPAYVWNEGFELPLTAAVFWAAVLGTVIVMRLHPVCGEVVRPMITVTMWAVAFVGCVAAFVGMFLLPAAIITLAARATLFGAQDAATLVFIYLIPAGVLFVMACRWIDENRGL